MMTAFLIVLLVAAIVYILFLYATRRYAQQDLGDLKKEHAKHLETSAGRLKEILELRKSIEGWKATVQTRDDEIANLQTKLLPKKFKAFTKKKPSRK